jgi:hypothetical protein
METKSLWGGGGGKLLKIRFTLWHCGPGEFCRFRLEPGRNLEKSHPDFPTRGEGGPMGFEMEDDGLVGCP